MEDRTNEHLVIYGKDGQVLATGEKGVKQIDITGLTPNTDYPEGSYTVAWVKENGDTSDKINVPDFKTLAILMESFTLAPDTITGTEGDDLNVAVTNINPNDATDKIVKATSKNPTIATIEWNNDAKTYQAHLIKAGTTEFDWVSEDGNASVVQTVTVNAKPAPAPSQPAKSNNPASSTPAESKTSASATPATRDKQADAPTSM